MEELISLKMSVPVALILEVGRGAIKKGKRDKLTPLPLKSKTPTSSVQILDKTI